jgi:hypothetical protein
MECQIEVRRLTGLFADNGVWLAKARAQPAFGSPDEKAKGGLRVG